jgi:hypothetical protein
VPLGDGVRFEREPYGAEHCVLIVIEDQGDRKLRGQVDTRLPDSKRFGLVMKVNGGTRQRLSCALCVRTIERNS